MREQENLPVEQVIRKARSKSLRRRVLALLSVFVLMVTTNQMIFVADTLEHVAACGMEEHTHSESCYDDDGKLTCELSEHEHTDACYQQRPKTDEDVVVAEAVSDEAFEELDAFELEDDGSEAETEFETASPDETEDLGYRYAVGTQNPVYLHEILEAVGLPADGSVEVGQVVDEAHPEGMIRIENSDAGVAIYPMQAFSDVELAVFEGEDIYTVTLRDAVMPEVEESVTETVEAEEETVETEEETAEAEGVEAKIVTEEDENSDPALETEPVEEEQTLVGENTEPQEQTEVVIDENSNENEPAFDEIEPEPVGTPEDAPEAGEAAEQVTDTDDTTANETTENETTEDKTAEQEETASADEAVTNPDPAEQEEDAAEAQEEAGAAPAEETDAEEPADGTENEAAEADEAQAADEEADDADAADDAAEEAIEDTIKKTFEAAFDLTDADAPFSLVAWVSAAMGGEAETESPVELWTVTCDEEALTVEATEGDWSVTPLRDFEETALTVDTGDAVCELTLTNGSVPAEEEVELEAAEAVVYTAEIDLTGVEAPYSLAGWMAQARPEDAEDETAPADEWTLEYDAEVFTVEAAEGDYSVTPVKDFEQAVFAVETGDARYELSLLNRAEAPEYLTGEVAVDVEGAGYTLLIDVPEAAKLPATATFRAVALNDSTYDEAALAAVADDDSYKVLATFDLTIYDDGEVIQPQDGVALGVSVDFGDALSANTQVYAVHFPGTGAQPEIEAQSLRAPLRVKRAAVMAEPQGLEIETEEVGTEILSTEFLDAENDGNGVVSFQADSFSVYAVVGTTPGVEIEMAVGSTEVIEPDFSTTYNKYTWTTSDSTVVSIVSGGNSAIVTVKAEAEGTAQLTLTYVSGTGKKAKTYHAYYRVTTIALTDADSTAQVYTDDTMTVSVKETGNLKKINDYHVVVEDADAEYMDDAVLKAYHIYLADGEGVEVDSAELGNGTLNLKVTINYNETPEWFAEAQDVKHYKNGAEQSISAVKIDAENNEISFIVHGFSEFTITSGGTVVTGGGQSVTTQQGSILDGKTFNDANEWQIVSGEYTDNKPENKDSSEEGRIRVQKNVIPTDVENEFNVYLSVDTSSLYEKYFELATYNAVTQNASHDMTLGVFYDTIVISSSVHVAPSGYSNGPFYVTIKAPNGTVLINNLELYWDSSNNFTVYIATSRGYIVIANSVKAGNRYTVTLSQASYDAMQKDIVNTAPVLTSVVDTLGDYVVYDGVVAADGNVSHNNGVLTWTPTPKSSPSQTITDWTDLNGHQHQVTWNNNVAELVYKCHLDVTKDGFVSGQPYDVNKSAVLTYTGDVSGTVTFPVPQVKGTVYGFEFTKVDEAGNALPGATFKITGPSNNPDVSSSEKTATSGNDGKVSFNDLPWGTYSLEETVPPVGYQKSADSPWTLNIGYTTDLADGTITEHTGNSTTPSVFPGVWIGRGMDWKITDKKNVITVTKSVETFGELDKTHINHTIYVVLWDRTDHKYVKDSSGNYVYGTIDIVNGIPSTTLTFDQYLESHSYSVWELLEQPTADMSESDIENITISPGTVVGTDSTGQKIELRGITTTYADLTNSNTADASINNKYEHQNETRKFTVNKKWISNRGTEIEPPEGGTVEFTLYRSENGGEPERVTSITLDGTEAVPWAATFQDLPSMNVETGYSYTYMVKETSHPEGYLPYLSASSSATPMGENDYQRVDGGSIYNKKQSTDITVKKIVEGLASDSNVDFEFTATLPEGTTFPAQADGIVTSGNTASFKLKDTETITLTDIPVDVVLSITESNDGTYTTTAEGRTGGTYNNYTYTFTVVDEDGVVTFKNTRATQKVRIFKTGDDLSGAPLGGATFDLTGEEVELSGLVSLATGTNAGYLPTQAGGTDTVFTLHVGDYSLKETVAPANYNKSDDVSINVNDHGVTYKVGDGEEITAEILNDAYTVIVTDTRKRTNITVTKILEDDFSDAAKNFVFHSTLMDRYTDITSQIPGLRNFTLKPGDQTDKSITFEGVPVGAELHITETSTGNGELDIENYSTSADATGVVLSEGTFSRDYSFTVSDTEEDIVVTFTNTRNVQKVKIRKIGSDKPNGLGGAKFMLETVNDELVSREGDGYLPNGSRSTEFELPVDQTYTLTETDAPTGYVGVDAFNINVAQKSVTVSKISGEGAPENVTVSGPDSDGVYTVTVKNNKLIDIDIVKQWYGVPYKAPVQVKLYSTYEGNTGAPTLVNNVVYKLEEINNWSQHVTGLPTVDSEGHALRYYIDETGIYVNDSEVQPVSVFDIQTRYLAVPENGTLPDESINGFNSMSPNASDNTLSGKGTLVVGNEAQHSAQFTIDKKWKVLKSNYDWGDYDPEDNLAIEGGLYRKISYTVNGEVKTAEDQLVGTVKYSKSQDTLVCNPPELNVRHDVGWLLVFQETFTGNNDGHPQLPTKGIWKDGDTYYPATFTYYFRETNIWAGDEDVTDQWLCVYRDATSDSEGWVPRTDLYNYKKTDLTIEKKWIADPATTTAFTALYFTVVDKRGIDWGKQACEDPERFGLTENDVGKFGDNTYCVKLKPAGSDGKWTGNETVVIKNLLSSANYSFISSVVGSVDESGEVTQDQWTEVLYTVTEVAYDDASGTHDISELCTPTYERKIRNNDWNFVGEGSSKELQLGHAGETRVRVTNALAYDVNILKTDELLTPLPGAHFALYDRDPSVQGAVPMTGKEDLVSGPDGKIALGMLGKGTYYLKETQAPSGYNTLTEPVIIKVDPVRKTVNGKPVPLVTYTQKTMDGTVTALSSTNKSVKEEETTNADGVTTYTYTLTVTNTSGARLPETGGVGTVPFTVGGLSLMGIALFLLMKRRMRAE